MAVQVGLSQYLCLVVAEDTRLELNWSHLVDPRLRVDYLILV
jgi:hypothetical protein